MTLTPPRLHEPQLAIRGFCDYRAIAAREPMVADSVGTVENRHLDRLLWMGGPGVQLRPANTRQATGQIQPDRLGVILYHPVNGIARQSVLAVVSVRMWPSLIRLSPPSVADPECTVPIDVETADHAFAQPFDGCVRGAE